MIRTEPTIVDAIREHARPLTGATVDYDEFIAWIGDARLVLLGEATHGTHEFYAARAEITRRLILEKDFAALAIEGDWPDAYRVNRFVRCERGDERSIDALVDFKRFPTWMWRNSDVLDFVGWLRDHNERLPVSQRVGFYGLDLYSLFNSMSAVIGYLEAVDPKAAAEARRRYACFAQYGDDPQAYGYSTRLGLDKTCEDEVVAQLVDLQRRAADYLSRDGLAAEDELFYAEQNARVALNAEEYYRAMFEGRAISWNHRDTHMAETLDGLMNHLSRHGRKVKVAVWAHNSHLGDARATEFSIHGELNLGQLARERWDRDVASIGFTTHSGTVSAASDWDGPVKRMTVRPALRGSFEAMMHQSEIPQFALDLHAAPELAIGLRKPHLERAIGVIYRPDTERPSHYFHASLSDQFDFLLHFDETRAVEPLDPAPEWTEPDLPETYPTGL